MTRAAEPTKVLVVDDHGLFAESLRIVLEMEGYACKQAPVATSPSSAALLVRVLRSKPHIVLLDLDLGVLGDATQMIQSLTGAGIDVIVVTGSPDRVRWGECVRFGAAKVLIKTAPLEEILVTIRRVARSLPVMAADERERLLRAWHEAQSESRSDREHLRRLTGAESRVLGELMRGHTVAEIAQASFVSEATVRTQVKSVLAKLEVSSQIAAVGLAHRVGWAPPGASAPPQP